MKRLLKAEYYDSKDVLDSYSQEKVFIDIYKNPSMDELDKINKNQKESTGSSFRSFRFFINDEGRLFAWMGDVIHNTVKIYLSGTEKDIHMAYEEANDEVYMHSIGGRDINQFVKAIKNARSNLEKAGIMESCRIDEILSIKPGFSAFKSLADIYNYEGDEDETIN